MTIDAARTGRDDTRERLLEVAGRLLAEGGAAAVTTRAVAAAAGVQAPTIYRQFGDKDGLLDAVVEQGVANWVAGKQRRRPHPDPVRDLRAGWDLSVAFALDNPGLATLMYNPARARSPALEAGRRVLADRIARVAAAGRLAVPEQRALELMQVAGTGTVLALLGQAAERRDRTLSEAAYRAVAAQILVAPDDQPAAAEPAASPSVTAAVQLRAVLSDVQVLTAAERRLLVEWLDRIADPDER